MRVTSFLRSGVAGVTLMALSMGTVSADPLADGFRAPPDSARPRVWWHWMNGNITRDGIRKDLEWMKRVGIAGLQNFDVNQDTPQIVPERLVYMKPDWRAAFRYAAGLADRLGLELGIAAAPGWSETGGPWVAPADAMKKLAWSETLVKGGKPLSIRLPAPPATTGIFQDLPIAGAAPTLYRDAVVLAYPVADPHALPIPRYTSGDKMLDAAALTDDSLTTAADVAKGSRQNPTIVTVDYTTPQTIRSASFFAPDIGPNPISAGLLPVLEASDDGVAWRAVTHIAVGVAPSIVSFAPVTAAHFRLVLAAAPTPAAAAAFGSFPKGVDLSALGALGTMMTGGSRTIAIRDFRLSGEARVNQAVAKAGFWLASDYYALDADTGPDVAGPAPRDVVDLTTRMAADGTLAWTPPPGDWRIVRLGWSLLGKTNHPATAEATGLEVDKLDPAAVRRYLDHYLGTYRDAAGAELLGAHGVRALVNDSTEVGTFNWTPTMIADFTRLRGYDPTPWLPALTGALIGSRRQSDAFLYDFRRTIADLHSQAHYATIAAVAHEHGLKTYGEALENGRPSFGDDMAMRSHTDYPMAAMWFIPRGVPPRATFLADMKGAASVAHIYGQNVAAAESMTSILYPYATGPADLRQTIDLEFAHGINRPVIHTSVHQPVDDKIPGLSLGPFGQYFNRHETWAEMARPWMDYMARSAFLLQQGRNVADVGYFYGEEAPLTELYKDAPAKDAPVHYAYDFVNAGALLGNLSVEGTEIVAKGGARYRSLYLGGSSARMTLPVLRRLAALVEGGATIVGDAPTGSPALADDPATFVALVAQLWAGGPETHVGKGRVIAGHDVETALRSIGVAPDFTYTAPASDAELVFVHRTLADGEVYFVDNRRFREEPVEMRFRVTGKTPELWHADTGVTEPVSYRIENGATIVPMRFGPEESVFVVFRKPSTRSALTLDAAPLAPVATLDGPWDVAFQPGRGAPISMRLPALASLSAQSDPGVRYFSGVATYTKRFTAPRAMKRGARLMLDLGTIGDIAEVRVNGRLVGTAWHAPYRVDIGRAVKPGTNSLDIRVADLWVNRLIGDQQPGAARITYTSTPTYTARAPLRPSGLIGPVTLLR